MALILLHKSFFSIIYKEVEMKKNYRKNWDNGGYTNTYKKPCRLSQIKTYHSDKNSMGATVKLSKQIPFYTNFDIFMPVHPIPP
jgi:hypothetical protein